MQEFLVSIEIDIEPSMEPDRLEALRAAERRVGQELRQRGAIERIWRVPGTTSNVGIWRAGDATELHELISSLPLFPWMTVDVTALAVHPLEAADAGRQPPGTT